MPSPSVEVVVADPSADDGEGKSSISFENNLQAAVQISLGEEVRVVYPDQRRRFYISDSVISVCLRDDPNISGTCWVEEGASIRASESFGSFGLQAAEVLQKEQEEIQREQHLLQKRKKKMAKAEHVVRHDQVFVVLPCFISCSFLFFAVVVLCIILEPSNIASTMLLSSLAVLAVGCMSLCLNMVQMTAVMLRHGRLLWHAAFTCNVLGVLCLWGVAVRYFVAGYWHGVLVIGVCSSVLVVFVLIVRFRVSSVKKDTDRSERFIQKQVAERTIVFNGTIRPGNGKCVCSWPGKYESAWDALVKQGRQGEISAALVFLPQGSKHFGVHDPIPKAEKIKGKCWCIPLYGEAKPWGCRWWTNWIANIEVAVREGAELEVYFFHGMKGKGKVQNFLTAGQEHLRREALHCQRCEFMAKSAEFQIAVKEGIEGLSNELRGDSSSQYSREVQRLFLAWLSEEDREFMEASEGLGNSQKAEVAWLERKGYSYSEVEVDVSKWVKDVNVK